jgi:lysophospholipase L1-like esterase
MARTKLLTDAVYSPTIAASEEAIRTQIDDSIQEVLDLALEDVTTNRKLSPTGDFRGTINGGDVTLTEPGLSGAFNAHLADVASAETFGHVKVPSGNIDTNGMLIFTGGTGSDNSLQFLKLLENGQVTKIKLIGDSITEGEGSTGHTVPSENPIIFDDTVGTVFREGDYTCRCWANLFREYIQANFPTIQFINAGIGGKSSKWANANKQYWVTETEDVVFVMLGTNDRWDCVSMAEFKTQLGAFLEYVDARSNLMIVMTANPVITEEHPFGMKEVDRVITELCVEKNYIHISQYRELLELANTKQISFSSLFQTTGSHPIDTGYKMMWQTIQQSLGFIDNTAEWEETGTDALVMQPANAVMADTPATSFGANTINYCLISSSHSQIAQFPESLPGTLITIHTDPSGIYTYQEYYIRQSDKKYKRYWIYASSVWSAWVDDAAGKFNLVAGALITSTTVITSFGADVISASLIGSSHPDKANFPEGLHGTLLTYRFSEAAAFGYQVYTIYQTEKTYKRHWTGSAWSAWQKISAI